MLKHKFHLVWTSVLLLFATVCTAATVTIAPKAPVLHSGETIRFTANRPVTWSLAPGSAGTIDSDGTYHAPQIEANNQMAGCQMLPNDDIFNTRIDHLPLHPNSAAWMDLIPRFPIGYLVSWGINIADNTTPRRRMHFAYTPQNDGVFEYPVWPHLKKEGGAFLDNASGGDRHMMAIDRETCEGFEVYNDYPKGVNQQCPSCDAQSGAHYSGSSYELPHAATDAAGLLLAPLTLHLGEIYSGAVKHALRVTLRNGLISPDHVWPATANANPWGKIPYGTRFRLKAAFDTRRFSPIAKILLTQLKEYGLILADGGEYGEVDVSTDLTEDAAVQGALAEVHGAVTMKDFEIVNEAPLMISPSSGQVRFDNPYERPDSTAVVIATPQDNPSETQSVRVVLRAVTVGFPDPVMTIQSGVTRQLTSWVNGTEDQKVIWTMQPSIGSLTPSGQYTPPDVTRPTFAKLTATSAADPRAKATLAVTILPKGSIRIDVGNATGAPGAPNRLAPDYGPDSQGHMWWRELGGEVSWGLVNDTWSEPWPKIPDIGVFYTNRYALGDMVYRFVVPNGRYKISLLFGQNGCKKFEPITKGPIHVETQGAIVLRNFNWGAPVDYACNTPVTQDIPAQVTDNQLYFALRVVNQGNRTPAALLNGFVIAPDNSPAHLSVVPSAANIVFGQDLPLRAVGWGTSDRVTWSVVKGPGSVTPEGLYKGPEVPSPGDQTIVVQARNAASLTATATLTMSFGNLQLTPENTTLQRGLKKQFECTLNGRPYKNVAWSVSPAVGSINPTGLYQAPATITRDTTLTITAESRDVPRKSVHTTLSLQSRIPAIRIACGGNAFRDAAGNQWSADYGFTPSMADSHPNPIAGASPDMQRLYQASRYCYGGQSFSYNFDLPNGRYSVTLKFADFTWTTPGNYDINVLLNGRQVLKDFDPDKEKAPRTAVDKTFQVNVDHEHLQITIAGGHNSALLNGIEIVPLE